MVSSHFNRVIKPFGHYPTGMADAYWFDGIPHPQIVQSGDEEFHQTSRHPPHRVIKPFGNYLTGMADAYWFDGIPHPLVGKSANEGKRFQTSLTQIEPCSWKWPTNLVKQI